jgi:hypothetical protein
MGQAVDAANYRMKAIRYWERRRRWIFLGLLALASLGGFFLTSEVAGAIDMATAPAWFTVLQFAFGFVGANVAYSLVYVLEFGFMGTRWQRAYWASRRTIFVLGYLLGMALAAIMAQQLASERYTVRLNSAP